MLASVPGLPLSVRVIIMRMRDRKTFEERGVCRLRMRIIITRTERGRPGTEASIKGTVRRARVILNRHVVVSNLIGHCVDHAALFLDPHLIASSTDLLMLVQPQRTRSTTQRVDVYIIIPTYTCMVYLGYRLSVAA